MRTHVVDLSHVLIPKKMNRELEVNLLVGDTRPWGSEDTQAKPAIAGHPVEQRETVSVPEGNYFLMSDIRMNSHIGTHIEIPYHCMKGQQDFTGFPVERLFGPAVFLRLKGYPPGSCLGLEDVKKAATVAGGIKKDDIVMIETGYDRYFFSDGETYGKAPYPAYEAVKWIVGHGIKMFGIDVGMIESPRNPRHDNHLLIMETGASLVENMAHVYEIKGHRAMVYCFPLAMKGADSMPVRLVAIEEVEE